MDKSTYEQALEHLEELRPVLKDMSNQEFSENMLAFISATALLVGGEILTSEEGEHLLALISNEVSARWEDINDN